MRRLVVSPPSLINSELLRAPILLFELLPGKQLSTWSLPLETLISYLHGLFFDTCPELRLHILLNFIHNISSILLTRYFSIGKWELRWLLLLRLLHHHVEVLVHNFFDLVLHLLLHSLILSLLLAADIINSVQRDVSLHCHKIQILPIEWFIVWLRWLTSSPWLDLVAVQ